MGSLEFYRKLDVFRCGGGLIDIQHVIRIHEHRTSPCVRLNVKPRLFRDAASDKADNRVETSQLNDPTHRPFTTRVSWADVDKHIIKRKPLDLFVQQMTVFIGESPRLIVGDDQPSDNLPRQDLRVDLVFDAPAIALVERSNNFSRRERTIQSDRERFFVAEWFDIERPSLLQ